MPAPVEFRAVLGADLALVAATPKCVLGIKAAAGRVVVPTRLALGLRGTTATLAGVLVELMACTFATNAPGTASTSRTPVRVRGPAVTLAATAAHSWTTEPTALTSIAEWPLEPKSGVIDLAEVLGREAISGVAEGYVIRLTSVDTVAAANGPRGFFGFEE